MDLGMSVLNSGILTFGHTGEPFIDQTSSC